MQNQLAILLIIIKMKKEDYYLKILALLIVAVLTLAGAVLIDLFLKLIFR
jgi:hypothetical protein